VQPTRVCVRGLAAPPGSVRAGGKRCDELWRTSFAARTVVARYYGCVENKIEDEQCDGTAHVTLKKQHRHAHATEARVLKRQACVAAFSFVERSLLKHVRIEAIWWHSRAREVGRNARRPRNWRSCGARIETL